MKLTINNKEVEYKGFKGFLLSIAVYLFSAFILFGSFLVIAASFLFVAFILLSPVILVLLVTLWLT